MVNVSYTGALSHATAKPELLQTVTDVALPAFLNVKATFRAGREAPCGSVRNPAPMTARINAMPDHRRETRPALPPRPRNRRIGRAKDRGHGPCKARPGMSPGACAFGGIHCDVVAFGRRRPLMRPGPHVRLRPSHHGPRPARHGSASSASTAAGDSKLKQGPGRRPGTVLPGMSSFDQCRIWLRNSLVRSCCGLPKKASGSFCSMI